MYFSMSDKLELKYAVIWQKYFVHITEIICGWKGEVNLLIFILQFPMSEDVKIKICSDLAQKGLVISQKLFLVDRNLVDEV